jgi:transcriptional regulator with XRE-family HTH domain
MSVRVDGRQLRREMVRRGWDAVDLAREARLSPATLSAALAGRPIAASSLSLIAAALVRTPAVEMLDKLMLREPDREVDI